MPFPRLNSEQEQNRIAELERQLASSEEIRHVEKDILIAEIEAHTETKRQLAEARKALREHVERLSAPVSNAEQRAVFREGLDGPLWGEDV